MALFVAIAAPMSQTLCLLGPNGQALLRYVVLLTVRKLQQFSDSYILAQFFQIHHATTIF